MPTNKKQKASNEAPIGEENKVVSAAPRSGVVSASFSEREMYEQEVRNRLNGTYEAVQAEITHLQEGTSTLHDTFDRAVLAQIRERNSDHIGDLLQARSQLFVRRIDYEDTQNIAGRTTIYVGASAVAIPDYIVTSWAAPIVGQLLYAPYASEEYHGRTERIGEADVRHNALRQVQLTYSSFSDEAEPAMEADLTADAYLVSILKQTARKALAPIIRTIQAEQYAIIAAPSAKIRIIQGVPGSGKTVIALHRIAYVLFNSFRSTAGLDIKANGVLFVGPNARFFEHVKEVLPSLGQRRINTTTPQSMLSSMKEEWNTAGFSVQHEFDTTLAIDDVMVRNRAMQLRHVLGSLKMSDYVVARMRALIQDETGALIDASVRMSIDSVHRAWLDAVYPFMPEPREPHLPSRRIASQKLKNPVEEQQKLDAEHAASVLKYNAEYIVHQQRLAEIQQENVEIEKRRVSYIRQISSFEMHARLHLVLSYELINDAVEDAIRQCNGRLLLLRNNLERAIHARLWGILTEHASYQSLNNAVGSSKQTVMQAISDVLMNGVRNVFEQRLPTGTTKKSTVVMHRAYEIDDMVKKHEPELLADAVRSYDQMSKAIFVQLFVNDAVTQKFFTHGEIDLLLSHSKKIATYADAVLLNWISIMLQGELYSRRLAHYSHVVIDEAQDLSPLFVKLLTRLIPTADFTLYGDIAQNIFQFSESTAWKEYAAIFGSTESAVLKLTHTYRSTAVIMSYAYRILTAFKQRDYVEPIAIIPDGQVPEEIQIEQIAELATIIKKHQAGNKDWTIGVIAKTQSALRLVEETLVPLFNASQPAFLDQIRFVTVSESKGLEFDSVYVVDADERTYPNDKFHSRMLFVACTRAVRTLYVCHAGPLTKLIPPPEPPAKVVEEENVE